MPQAFFKNALTLCKSIMRNGSDAYVVNMALQYELIQASGSNEVDIACDAPFEELLRVIPSVEKGTEEGVIAILREEGALYRFYQSDAADASPPQYSLTRITPNILRRMSLRGPLPESLCKALPPAGSAPHMGFEDFASGRIRLEGLPEETLRRDYILGVRTLRHAANLDLPVEPNTWVAILRAAQHILDYLPARDILNEWSAVQPAKMWKFVRLLKDSQIMHGLIPEIAALDLLPDPSDKNPKATALDFTIESMREYAEGDFLHDWHGVLAMLFHKVGKPYTAEYYDGGWTFFQHHRAGAKVTRKVLRRLHMDPRDMDLICHLVRHHMHFHFMMTDKGLRRFLALEETPRLMQMAKADILASGDTYTAFNHNMKYLQRAQTPEQLLEPMLNGNEIMEHTRLSPGPHVGIIRQDLLKAQIAGEVTTLDQALAFVRRRAQEMSSAT